MNKEIEPYIAMSQITVVEAMRRIDKGARGILFIVDGEERLIGCVTDGDIRRWLISTADLSSPISRLMSYSPIYMHESEIIDTEAYMKRRSITALPILNSKHQIVKIVFLNAIGQPGNDQDIHSLSNVPVVVMAGGKGTRLYPYTRILPKPLIPVGDLPIVEHIIRLFCRFECKDFYLIVNHKKNMIKSYFNEIDEDYNIVFVDEEAPLGTGGGLSLLKGMINCTFILTNCDILIKEDFFKIYDFHKKNKNIITMICSLKNFCVPYGVVEIGKHGELISMQEKPNFSFFTNTGCYIVEPEVIMGLKENQIIDFPNIVENYKNQGKRIGVYPIGESAWLDMGRLDELENMRTSIEK